jgi:predicted phage-related endonuclease
MTKYEQWRQAKLGKISASNVAKLMTGGRGKTRQTYIYQVATEILTGIYDEGYISKAMQRGIDKEPAARAEYAFQTEQWVEGDGITFYSHSNMPFFGASPDCLISPDGLGQIKCPDSSTHIAFCVSLTIPDEYQIQMQSEMFVMGREWNDFISFDDRVQDCPLAVVRLMRNHEMCQKISDAVNAAWQEVQDIITTVRRK